MPRLRHLFLCAFCGCGWAEIQPIDRKPIDPNVEVAVSGIRRLSRVEMDATIQDLIGDTARGAQQLIAPDPTNPYDNEYRQQLASTQLIEALERIATEAAERLVLDPARLASVLPCTPTGASDAACLRGFISSFGHSAMRRPLTEEEITNYLALQSFAVEANDFKIGVKLVVQAMLQHPELVYRIEVGTKVAGRDGVFQLSPHQVAARLSYFLWGTTPPPWLLDAAEAGQLSTSTGVRQAAQRLIEDPRARSRVERFHALWLSYHRLPATLIPGTMTDLAPMMQAESAALVDKVVFDDKSDYFELFRSTSTFINSQLATHYGIAGFGGGAASAWTPYGSAPRKGILSHGSVLAAGVKVSDTSPTQRGIFIRTRLFCQEVGRPPPGVNTDEPPTSTTGSNCKVDRYAAHAQGGCGQCHANLDPVGFGLENFSKTGQYRTHDDADASCNIAGDGQLTGTPMGTASFNGVVGLADLMLQTGDLEQCTVKQVFRFAFGRKEEPADLALLEKLTNAFKEKNRGFQELLIDVVADDTYAFRRDE